MENTSLRSLGGDQIFGRRTNKRRFNKRNIKNIAPEGPGIYEIVNSKGESLYIGKSNNVKRRLLEHMDNRDVRGAHSFRTYKPPRGYSAERYEDILIQKKKPKRNRRPW